MISKREKLKAIFILKIVTTSMIFSTQINHVVRKLNRREELREFMGAKEEEIPKENKFTFPFKVQLK